MKEKNRVWIFTFEYAGVAKVGGLGEVPANQARSLTEFFDFTVFVPSHGQMERLRKEYEVEKLPFNCVGQINPNELGFNEPESSYYIRFYKLKMDGVNIITISGENEFTRKYLDDPIVYNPDTFKLKLCLYSIAIRCYTTYITDHHKEDLPNVIHLHDYHVVIPFIGLKQILAKQGFDVASIITTHLLTHPKFDLEFYFACGVDDTPISIRTEEKESNLLTIKEIFEKCKRQGKKSEPPTVERVGAFVSDLVITVSETYLKSDVIPTLGGDLIEFKTDYVWNGCDWDYEEVKENVLAKFSEEIRRVLDLKQEKEISPVDLKKYLLEYKIGNLEQSPLIKSKRILRIINEISNGNAFIKNGKIKSFADAGPLIITTGRISEQKGYDTLFKAIPKVIEKIPEAKFLFLLLPTDYSITEIKEYAEYVKKYPENLRIIFGLAAEIFHMAHLAADIYCALSRWEPFGIIALEAMAMKLPIIATKVGGLQESVIDIRKDPENGTGMLIKRDSVEETVEALITVLRLAQISESSGVTSSIYQTDAIHLVNLIPDDLIKSKTILDNNYYEKICENCVNRVENTFRWKKVSKKLITLYNNIIHFRNNVN
ncbi:MAG: glycosyltransferase [Promethearchaeia archaeon]